MCCLESKLAKQLRNPTTTGYSALYQFIWFLTNSVRWQTVNYPQYLKQCKKWHSVWQWRHQPLQCTAPHTVLLSGEWVCGCLCCCHWCRRNALHTQRVTQKLWAHGVQRSSAHWCEPFTATLPGSWWWGSHMLCAHTKKHKVFVLLWDLITCQGTREKYLI